MGSPPFPLQVILLLDEEEEYHIAMDEINVDLLI